jgi:phospholipid/cholesterol/gamma-HCH transport system substrate-binding protein
MQTYSPLRTRTAGAVGLTIVAIVVITLVGVYLKWFSSAVHVTVMSDRAGLLLDRGAAVRVSGVPVGEVRGTELADDHRVAIDVALDKNKLDLIPQDVTAEIRSTTVFGAKFVELDLPDGRSTATAARAISAGDVVQATSVPTEANDSFQDAIDVLRAVDAEKLNTTLGQMATALQGRGEKLGDYLTQVNDYLASFNQTLPTLATDIRQTRDVLKIYADLAPQFLDTADQAATTSRTLTANAATLHALLVDMVDASDKTKEFFDLTGDPLIGSMHELKPVTNLLRVYSPEVGCLIDSLARQSKGIGKGLGAVDPGIQGVSGFLPSQPIYDAKENRPKFVSGVGPICYPYPTIDHPVPVHVRFDDGTADVYDGIGPTANPGEPTYPKSTVTTQPTSASEGWIGMLRFLFGDEGTTAYLKALQLKADGTSR